MSTDFGRIAVGCRIGKHPEAAFFAAWTGLVVEGLCDGDIVLAPSAYSPAHWASDFLARQFLKSECDTLLMIDDDMDFPPDALGRLRANEASFGYDIVFALCTTRELPPVPVLLRLAEEQPGSGAVEKFDRVTRFYLGRVIPVDTVGLAFTLIRRRVFERMMETSLTSTSIDDACFFTYGPGRETDDAPFCRTARRLGFALAVDTAVHIDHIAAIPLGWRHVEKRQTE
jgi:hypothetical protein